MENYKYIIKGAMEVLGLLLVLSLASCAPRVIVERVTETIIEKRDSLVYRDSLIKVPIPLEKDQAIVHIGDTSRLETSVAESIAFVDSVGFLHHKLENKKGELSTIAKIPIRYIFTGVTTTSTETISKIEYKDKPLSWFQRFRLDGFWVLLALVIGLSLWTFRKLIF